MLPTLQKEFTFQYISILIQTRRWTRYDFKEIYIPICFYFNITNRLSQALTTIIYIPICFYFNNGIEIGQRRLFSIYIPICFYFNRIFITFFFCFDDIYIPICFYFNPSPEFPLLFYLISPLSVDQPKFTNILPYLLH